MRTPLIHLRDTTHSELGDTSVLARVWPGREARRRESSSAGTNSVDHNVAMQAPTYVATTSSVVELVPVISLGLEGSDIPPLPTEFSDDSLARWRLARRKAVGLDPDRPLDGDIALDEILTDRLLDAVVDYVVSCGAEYGWSPYLDGGFALVVDGQVFSRPTCCVDLQEGVRDWLQLAESWPADWRPVESGHPGVLARVRLGRVEVSEQADDFPDDITAAVSLPTEQLRAAAQVGLREVHAFAERLERRFVERGVEPAGQLARVVAGLADE